MNYNNVEPEVFGASLRGIGLNILVKDVLIQCAFLKKLFDMKSHQASADFTIMRYGEQVFQLHSDLTYHANPLLSLVPEQPPRGAGIEIRLYNSDPDEVVKQAANTDATILQPPTDKEHGLREAYILCTNGYAWVPSRPL